MKNVAPGLLFAACLVPEVGRVRFYVRTADGVYTVEAGQDERLNPKHPLHLLFRAGNDVITQLRLASEQQQE